MFLPLYILSEIFKIPSREIILNCLRSTPQELTLASLAKTLRISSKALPGLEKRIFAMCKDELLKVKKQGQIVSSNKKFITGRVSIHPDGFGFLAQGNGQEDLFILAAELSKVMHGDLVHVKADNGAVSRSGRKPPTKTAFKSRQNYKVIEILSRSQTHLTGTVEHSRDDGWIFHSLDRRLQQDVTIQKIDPKIKSVLRSGMVVVGKIVNYPDRFDAIELIISELLGEPTTPGIEIEIAVRRYAVPSVFPKEAIALGNKVSQKIDAVLSVAKTSKKPSTKKIYPESELLRIDLRALPFVTIDGADARDFDDAVYCTPIKIGKRGGYRLYVAIADVSEYVLDGDALDIEARLRATSVYFPQQVIPMLPESLSNGICSLIPNQDRNVLVCEIDIDSYGVTQRYEFYSALIHSRARLTYEQVAKVLQNDLDGFVDIELIAYLRTLKQLSDILLSSREKRGALNFEVGETVFEFNQSRQVINLHTKQRNDAHRLIEECMLAANVCAAEYLATVPSLFRVHEAPDPVKVKQLLAQLKLYGIGSVKITTDTIAQDLAALTKKIAAHPLGATLSGLVLRTMKQAVYSAKNKGHFGLAYDAYTHFTSPIRRYPDLLVHRAIKAKLEKRKYHPFLDAGELESVGVVGRDGINIWAYLGGLCSERERRADEAVRDVHSYWKCFFMQQKLGQELSGTIASVLHYGVFVQLLDWDIQGLISAESLIAAHYQYDETRLCWTNKANGKRLSLGGGVRVNLVSVKLNDRKIDFELDTKN